MSICLFVCTERSCYGYKVTVYFLMGPWEARVPPLNFLFLFKTKISKRGEGATSHTLTFHGVHMKKQWHVNLKFEPTSPRRQRANVFSFKC